MKAIRIHRPGGPEVLQYEDAPDPVAGPGQVLIQVGAAGINFSDLGARRNGGAPDVEARRSEAPVRFPIVAGGEAAGTVISVGDGVTGFRTGDAVACQPVPGCYAEKVVASITSVVKVPRGMEPAAAVAAMLQARTAYAMAFHAYPIRAGNQVLIQAGAGGVGLLLTQMAKMQGAYVLSTVGSDEKIAAAQEAGADHVVNYSRDDFAQAVMTATKGEGVNAIYDAVGQETFVKGLSCLASKGTLVSYGQASGPIEPFDLSLLARSGGYITRTNARRFAPTQEEWYRHTALVLDWAGTGKIKLRYTTYPLFRAADAHKDLEQRRSVGKLVLIP